MGVDNLASGILGRFIGLLGRKGSGGGERSEKPAAAAGDPDAARDTHVPEAPRKSAVGKGEQKAPDRSRRRPRQAQKNRADTDARTPKQPKEQSPRGKSAGSGRGRTSSASAPSRGRSEPAPAPVPFELPDMGDWTPPPPSKNQHKAPINQN